MTVPAVLADDPSGSAAADLLVGRCPGMQEVYKAVGRVARTDVTVLILGETGTGKELVARAVYDAFGPRATSRSWPSVNCAAIPDAPLESELFGHEKGAFTGADRNAPGRIRGRARRDGVPRRDRRPAAGRSGQAVAAPGPDVRAGGRKRNGAGRRGRVIAATNSPLATAAWPRGPSVPTSSTDSTCSRFSSLPPLRERGEDLDLLADYYLR